MTEVYGIEGMVTIYNGVMELFPIAIYSDPGTRLWRVLYAGEDGRFGGKESLTGAFLAETVRIFLNGEEAGSALLPEGTMTRAELAEAAQAVWTAYEAQKAPEESGEEPK